MTNSTEKTTKIRVPDWAHKDAWQAWAEVPKTTHEAKGAEDGFEIVQIGWGEPPRHVATVHHTSGLSRAISWGRAIKRLPIILSSVRTLLALKRSDEYQLQYEELASIKGGDTETLEEYLGARENLTLDLLAEILDEIND